MSLPQTVAEVLREHVTLEVEGIDRMYLNVYVRQMLAAQPGGASRAALEAVAVEAFRAAWSPGAINWRWM